MQMQGLVFILELGFTTNPDHHYDFSKCLDGVSNNGVKPRVNIQLERVVSCCK